MRWLFGHGSIKGFPAGHAPLLRAYDLETGKEVWTRDFSAYGCGGDDAGICLMDGRLYYSCFFGASARLRSGLPGPQGITAAIEPQTGKIDWLSTKYSLRSGATISGKDGRLYLGGYSPPAGSRRCYVWCLNAKDGSLVWQSEPLEGAIHVVSIGPQWLFAHAQYKDSYLLDKQTGKIRGTLAHGYKCTRFTFSGSCLLGPAMDVYELSGNAGAELLSTGPRMDPSECIGACVSNGRIFYTGHGAGLQASAIYGDEAASAAAEPIGRPVTK
jgi:outer membrane protein assembly factor BamB